MNDDIPRLPPSTLSFNGHFFNLSLQEGPSRSMKPSAVLRRVLFGSCTRSLQSKQAHFVASERTRITKSEEFDCANDAGEICDLLLESSNVSRLESARSSSPWRDRAGSSRACRRQQRPISRPCRGVGMAGKGVRAETLRLVALPLARKPHLTYYYADKKKWQPPPPPKPQFLDQDGKPKAGAPQMDASAAGGAGAGGARAGEQGFLLRWMNKGTDFGARQWDALGKAPKGNWKWRIYVRSDEAASEATS